MVCLSGIVVLGRTSLQWTLGEANWQVITRNLRVLTWGRYPGPEVWRLGVCLAILVGLFGWMVEQPAGFAPLGGEATLCGDALDRRAPGVGVLHVVDRVLGALLLGQLDVEVDPGADRT